VPNVSLEVGMSSEKYSFGGANQKIELPAKIYKQLSIAGEIFIDVLNFE